MLLSLYPSLCYNCLPTWTLSVRLRVDRLGGESIWSGTDVKADSVSLLLSLKGRFSSWSADLTSFPPVPDCGDSPFFLPREVGADGVLVWASSSSNSKGSANRESSKFSHSASANSHGFASDLSYNNPSSISTSRVLWIFPVRGW